MKVKLLNKNEIYDLNFKADFFEKIEEHFEDVEISMYEDLFLDLNYAVPIIFLLEKYDLEKLIGVESVLEKLSTHLQKKKIEAFFERHIEDVKWQNLSGNSSLSEDFFEKHLNTSDKAKRKVDWNRLSYNPSMSEAFFERHLDKVK